MSFVPQERWDYKAYPIGSPTIPQTIWGWTYDGLKISQGNRRLNNGSWTGGGPFYCVHNRHDIRQNGMMLTGTYGGTSRSGLINGVAGVDSSIKPSVASLASAPAWSDVESSLKADLTTGYSSTLPGNPASSLGQFLYELKEDPISASIEGGINVGSIFRRDFIARVKDRLKVFVNLQNQGANAYLNHVFGWKPFLRDLRQIYNLTHIVDRELEKIIRENNKPIRRKATLEDTTTTSETVSTSSSPSAYVLGFPAIPMAGGSQKRVVTRTTIKRWYVGKYRYYIPDTTSLQWNVKARLALFGALPTPKLIWDVLPWSWLQDWFTNIGEILNNVSANAVEGLVRLYTYSMHHQVDEVTYNVSLSWAGLNSPPNFVCAPGSLSINTVIRNEFKARQGGVNPFGFSVKLKDLSSYQLGIIAALGISRSKLSF